MTLSYDALWIATQHCQTSACHSGQPCHRCKHLAGKIEELVQKEVEKSQEGKEKV